MAGFSGDGPGADLGILQADRPTAGKHGAIEENRVSGCVDSE